MLTLTPPLKVFASLAPTDMRKSFHGLTGIVEKELGQSVEDGDLFLFFNRRRDKLKVLFFSGDGLIILYKQLEKGTFECLRRPRDWSSSRAAGESGVTDTDKYLTLRSDELTLLLDGIELASVKRRKWWRRERMEQDAKAGESPY
jgi:transposase